MLTRLKVRGFKSLEDVDIRFGPLTCIAGVNGVGKSNLFDAIAFLQRLAEMPILEAVRGVRNSGVTSLFTQTKTARAQTMEFEAEMLIEAAVADDFGRPARPGATYLRYRLALQYVPGGDDYAEGIALVSESLSGLPKAALAKALGFATSKAFLTSVHRGAGAVDFIRTDAGEIEVRREQSSGTPLRFAAAQATRTALSLMNVIDFPTALALKREMQAWTMLRLELSALRRPDRLDAPNRLSPEGAHLPATLERVRNNESIAGQLATLVPDVDDIFVRADPERRTRTLYLKSRSGVVHEAETLSDGMLRFLALAIVSADTETSGLICMEEPENGIHPGRLALILEQMKRTVVDPMVAVGADNPLRQMIVNTHSPLLVQNLLLDELIICHAYRRDGASLSVFSPLQHTWRDVPGPHGGRTERALGLGAVFSYLEGVAESAWPPTDKLNIEQVYKQELQSLVLK
jgi:predicted ATPase